MEIGSDAWKNVIFKGAKYLGVPLTTENLKLFTVYSKALMRWNRKVNLTAVTDPFDIAVKHIIDSIAPYHIIQNAASMLDVGSGAGFPGIPLKIIIPTIKTTLIDSSRKKVSFQNFIIRKLGLTDALAIHARVDSPPLKFKLSNKVKSSVHSLTNRSRTSPLIKEMNDQFDVIICRAIFSLDKFVMSVLPLMKETGRIVALKADINKSDLHTLTTRLEQLKDYPNAIYKQLNVSVRRYVLPFIEAKRSIIIVEGKEQVKI